MVASFTTEEILTITGGRLAMGMMLDEGGVICTDTRLLEPGSWYLALRGETFDGHDFIGDAFAGGARGCIVENRPAYPIAAAAFPLIAVSDTLIAYHQLATHFRNYLKPLVVAITGSSGKTTTKEMCFSVVQQFRNTHKSQANENNEYGLPKTILSMSSDTEVLIVEMAMRGLGEIDLLASTAQPDVGVITNAGTAHLGKLGSIDNIIKAKCELLKHLGASAVAVLGQSAPALIKRAKEVFSGKLLVFEDHKSIRILSVNEQSTKFQIEGCESQFEVHAHGLAHLADAWCAIQVGRLAGLADDQIAKGLLDFAPLKGRGRRVYTTNGALIVDEAYNANPDSVKAAIDVFIDPKVYPQTRKIVVLGQLHELGTDAAALHRQLGEWLKIAPIECLLTIGEMASNAGLGATGALFDTVNVADNNAARDFLRSKLTDHHAVLIKGSLSSGLGKLVSELQGTQTEP